MKKNHKKGSISEEDISTVLQRYSATTVLALLQEVAHFQDVKIDWNELVKKSTTGISNAREYQMLWRHLAYRDALHEKFDDGAQPLDDDSDLEYELEVLPTVSTEASIEAAACVKVLIASGLPIDSSQPNGSTVEAPLTINIPNSQSTLVPSENSGGTNIMVPVSVQKQQVVEGLESSGPTGGNLPPRRKRKTWSEKEDEELIAAVQKCGEGNWASILKGDFKIDRTASQLSQRWAIIRKRKGNLSNGGGSQLSEVQLATRRAMSIALNMPMSKDNLRPTSSIASTNLNTVPSISAHPTASEAPPVIPQTQHLSQQESMPTPPQRAAVTPGSLLKSIVTSNKLLSKPTQSADALVKAAAVAAGARIATPSDAASLLKAAQAKNAVHIMPAGPHSNVHYIRSGLAAPPLPTYSSALPTTSRPGGSQPVQVHGIKPCGPKVQPNATNGALESNPSGEPKVQKDQAPGSVNAPKEQVKDDKPSISGNLIKGQLQDDKACVYAEASNKQDQNALPASENKVGDDPMVGINKSDTINSENMNDDKESAIVETCGGINDDKESAIVKTCGDQSVNSEKMEVQNGSDDKAEIVGKVSAGSE